jgi:hypothetical protein
MDLNDFKGKSPDFTWRRWPGSNEPRLIWNSQPCTRNSFPWIVKTRPQKRVQVNFYNFSKKFPLFLFSWFINSFSLFQKWTSRTVDERQHCDTHTHTKKRWWEKTRNISKEKIFKKISETTGFFSFLYLLYIMFFPFNLSVLKHFPICVCVCVCDDCRF